MAGNADPSRTRRGGASRPKGAKVRPPSATVVDASAVAALLFVEPDAARVARDMADRDLFAPSLLPYELASVAHEQAALHPDMTDRILEALGMADRLGIGLVDVDPVDEVLLARETSLATYDAAYLALARDLGLPLTTLDAALRRASRRAARPAPRGGAGDPR